MTTPLRIAVDATAIPADRGGVGRYVDELVRALPDTSVTPTVLCQPRDVEHFRGLPGVGDVVAAPAWAARPPARLVWEQTGLPALLRGLDVQLLHSPHYTMPLVARRRLPVVVTLHDATFFSHPQLHHGIKARFFADWTRLSCRTADALVVPSVATREEVVRYAAADPGRVAVIPHGVDHDRFRVPDATQRAAARAWLGLGDQVEYVAFLGTLEPRKNVPALVAAYVNAFRDASDPPALVLAGGRGWDREIDAAVAAVPSPLTVLRPGFIPDHLVAGFLGGAVVVAYPSLGEGFGLPVVEAMACGAPVLTTSMLSLPEVGGDAVAYAATPDSADIADTLTRLVHDPGWRAQLSVAGPRRARTFDWARAARGHRDVYDRVLERARSRPAGRRRAR